VPAPGVEGAPAARHLLAFATACKVDGLCGGGWGGGGGATCNSPELRAEQLGLLPVQIVQLSAGLNEACLLRPGTACFACGGC